MARDSRTLEPMRNFPPSGPTLTNRASQGKQTTAISRLDTPSSNRVLNKAFELNIQFGVGRKSVFIAWSVWMLCVVIGTLSSGDSALMGTVGRLHIDDKVLHFCAYAVLSFLAVTGFRDRRRGIAAGLSMFIVGCLLELAQHFSPGRSVDFGDAMANGGGVCCGVLLAPVIGRMIPLRRAASDSGGAGPDCSAT